VLIKWLILNKLYFENATNNVLGSLTLFGPTGGQNLHSGKVIKCCMQPFVQVWAVNTLGELTLQNLWSRYVRHFVGITWHNGLSTLEVYLSSVHDQIVYMCVLHVAASFLVSIIDPKFPNPMANRQYCTKMRLAGVLRLDPLGDTIRYEMLF